VQTRKQIVVFEYYEETTNSDSDPFRSCTAKIDVYAFAVTLYLMWAPTPPKVSAPLLADCTIPAVYQYLIGACWQDDPELRPSFADLLSLFDRDRSWVFPGTNDAALAGYAAKVLDGLVLSTDWKKPATRRPLWDLMINASDYALQFALGHDAFGVVYRAKNIHTGELVALTQMHSMWEREDQKLFLREINILSGFGHPALVGFRGKR
jgi:hypothetical protein